MSTNRDMKVGESSADQTTTCNNCDRERTERDCLDYDAMQVIFGRPLGWYSGDDGEICGECMTEILRGGR